MRSRTASGVVAAAGFPTGVAELDVAIVADERAGVGVEGVTAGIAGMRTAAPHFRQVATAAFAKGRTDILVPQAEQETMWLEGELAGTLDSLPREVGAASRREWLGDCEDFGVLGCSGAAARGASCRSFGIISSAWHLGHFTCLPAAAGSTASV